MQILYKFIKCKKLIYYSKNPQFLFYNFKKYKKILQTLQKYNILCLIL